MVLSIHSLLEIVSILCFSVLSHVSKEGNTTEKAKATPLDKAFPSVLFCALRA